MPIVGVGCIEEPQGVQTMPFKMVATWLSEA